VLNGEFRSARISLIPGELMKVWLTILVLILLHACGNPDKPEQPAFEPTGFLHDIAAFTSDSFVNVVIEIPAGTNEKWEVNKKTGQIEWEQVNPDSLRIIDYLAYPANYGFVPQTLLTEITGGDGDPVDVFVLGPSIARETIISVRIVGIIHMLDDNESDSKLLAVESKNPVFDVNSFEMLEKNYPGVVDIIKLWLLNYKGQDRIEILSVQDEKHAIRYLKEAHNEYINMNHE
jgi:inorganic pyrophosphatase